MADEKESKRTSPRWKTTDWCGHENYQCTQCPFATLDYALIVEHARESHPTVSELERAGLDPLVGIVFASGAAETEARNVGLDRGAFAAHVPSSVRGYTVDDVRDVARSAQTSGE